MIKFLIWLDNYVRKSYSINFFISIIWKFSIFLNKRFLKKLQNRLSKEKWKTYFLNNEDDVWQLVQHLDEYPLIQNEWLSIFKLFGNSLSNKAYLEDRVLVNLKGVQRYGTQIKENGDHYILYPILGMEHGIGFNDLDIQALNRRRQKMNLEPIENYADSLFKELKVFIKF